MGENNTYKNESKSNRLKRFRNNPPIEIIENLLLSIQNYFNNEIQATLKDLNNPQTLLMILGIHSVAMTIAYGFFNKEGEKGYRKFLKVYMDGDTPDTKFSTIAKDLHEWRNVITHRWLNVKGHEMGYDFNMNQGWKKIDGVIFINPRIYLERYLRAFSTKQGGMLYRYTEILDTEENLQSAKNRLLSKYEGNA